MSRISQDFINSVGYLYEEINTQQNDFLNEESQYYDAEASELVEDILAAISTSMVYEGYSAEGIIGFLADSSDQDIVEKYLSFDENVLVESTISEDYITEQLKLFDVAIDEGIGSLIGKVAKGAIGLAGRVASKPARAAVAKKLASSANPEKTRAAVQRLAQKSARNANVGGYSSTMSPIGGGKLTGKQSAELLTKAKLSQGAQKVKDIAQGAKKALPGIAKGAGIFGLGAAGGYVGAKMAGAGSGEKSAESPKPPTKTPAPAAPKLPPASTSSGGGSTPSGSGVRRSKPSAPATSKQTGDKAKDMATWAKANPKLAAKLNPDGTQKGTGQSEIEKNAEELRQMVNRSKQRQGSLMGGPEGPGKIDTKSVDAAMKAEQERQKKRLESQNSASTTTKETYEPYNVILSYLLSEGHADTVDEANYIMLEMDETAVGTIIEEYEDYLLAEEIQEWVNGLLDEGYDLSKYSWDDIVEYYVNEARQEEGESDKRKRRIRRSRLPYDGGKGKRAEEIRQQWHKDSRGRRGESPLASRPRYQDEPGRRIRGQGYVRYSDHED